MSRKKRAKNKRTKRNSKNKKKTKKQSFYKQWWFIFILGIIAGLFLATLVRVLTPNKQKNLTQTDMTIERKSKDTYQNKKVTGDFVKSASDAYFDGQMLKGNSYSIRIKEYKIIPNGQEGNEKGDKPVIAFWYDTLVSPDYEDDKPINPSMAWVMNFKATQENDANELQLADLPDDSFKKSQSEAIKPGDTVTNAVAYQLTDDKAPVNLIVESILGDKLGETEYPLIR